MVQLISPNDKGVLPSFSLTKNAVFYKDMLAFFDAYENLLSADPKALPNYCYWNGKYILEGICLFMKDYGSELGFETLNLSLDYLKVLYFSIASYSTDGNFPERSVIEQEFDAYNTSCEEQSLKATEARGLAELEFNKLKEEVGKNSKQEFKSNSISNVFNFLSIFSLIFSLFCFIAPLTFYFLDVTELVVSLIIAACIIVVGVVLFLTFRKLSRVYDTKENGKAYELEKSKRRASDRELALSEVFLTYSKLLCESYEGKNNLSESLTKQKTYSFDEILHMASFYSVPSYNMRFDCLKIFQSQDKEIEEMTLGIKNLEAKQEKFDELYAQICEKDFLFFSQKIRFNFLCKFADFAEKTFNWHINLGGKKVFPFEINLRQLASEPVAFLKSREALFVTSSADKFMNSDYLKNQNVFKLKTNPTADELTLMKFAYLTKFFDYEKVKKYNNIFYDKKIGEGTRVPDQIYNSYKKIPTLAYLKLRLIENDIGLGNSDSEAVKQISSSLFLNDYVNSEPKRSEVKKVQFDKNELKSMVYDCVEIEEIDEFRTKFKDSDREFIGYKV